MEAQYKLRERIERPIICVVTKGEILSLIEKLGWGVQKRQHVKDLLGELVIADININEVVDRYAEIDFFLSKAKPARTIQQNDMWIAAVASVAEAHLLSTDKDLLPLNGHHLKLHWIDESLA